MKENINQKAWNILREDEKVALTLSLGHGQSSWQAGEIMGRAHFKYLEIQKRAAKFLELFTNHYEKYGKLIPVELNVHFSFEEYLLFIIEERLNISTTVGKMENSNYLVASSRNKWITAEMEKLAKNNSEAAKDLFGLILDFDRWNNFRILPPDIQEPSAFKRRNKSRDKKHIKNLLSLPEFSVLRLIEKFSSQGKKNMLYLPMVSNYLHEGYKIVPIKNSNKTLETLNDIGLFVFEHEYEAIKYAHLIYDFFLKSNFQTCISGQKFWPKYRELVSKAYNIKQVENISRSRVYLENAIFERLPKKKVK